jgi:hypothetical protein
MAITTVAALQSSAQSRNTFFPDRPNACECKAAKSWRTGNPLVKEALMNTDLVSRYLTRIDLLFMEEMGYWFRVATGTLPRDIDTFVSNSDVTVSFGDGLQAVFPQNGPDSRRVAFIHLINAKNEHKIDSLFNGKTAEQRVLGTARSALLG